MGVRVSLRFFASHREKVGQDRLTFDLPEGARVGDAVEAVAARFPDLRTTLRVARFAVNRAYAPESEILHDGDEVAFIPPVAGG